MAVFILGSAMLSGISASTAPLRADSASANLPSSVICADALEFAIASQTPPERDGRTAMQNTSSLQALTFAAIFVLGLAIAFLAGSPPHYLAVYGPRPIATGFDELWFKGHNCRRISGFLMRPD
jgi:hypothetical protein